MSPNRRAQDGQRSCCPHDCNKRQGRRPLFYILTAAVLHWLMSRLLPSTMPPIYIMCRYTLLL